MVNQIELHPQLPQYELQEYCRSKGISIESWGPLMQGQIFDRPLMKELAEKYKCSIAQLALVWQFMQNNIALVKSIHPKGLKPTFRFLSLL